MSVTEWSFSPLSSVWFGVFSSSLSDMSWMELHFSLSAGGPGLFWGVLDGVEKGVEDGVLVAELGAVGVLLVLSSCSPFPFSSGLSLSLISLVTFFAFLNSTEVRRPTPPVVGRGGALSSGRPLATTCPSLCKMGGGDAGHSCALVQLMFPVVLSERSSSSFRRLQGQLEDLGSPVIGRRVGGSRGASPCRGGGAGPVGSSVGGDVDLRSSGRWKEKNELNLTLPLLAMNAHLVCSVMWRCSVHTGKWCHFIMISFSLTTAQRELRYSVDMEDLIKTSEYITLLSQLYTSNMVTWQLWFNWHKSHCCAALLYGIKRPLDWTSLSSEVGWYGMTVRGQWRVVSPWEWCIKEVQT